MASAESETERLLRVERPAIAKIVAFTAQEHSTILFTIAYFIAGYAKDGHLQWITTTGEPPCATANPELSHGNDKVLYRVGDGKDCHLLIYDMKSHKSKQLLQLDRSAFDGASWAWDDSQIAFFDKGGVIVVTTIAAGDQRVVLPKSEVEKDEYQHPPLPIQWLHDDRALIITLAKFVPDPKQHDPRWTSGRTVQYVATVSDGHAHVIGVGDWPSVSPVRDEIAAFANNSLVVMTLNGNQQKISNAPRYPRYLPLFSGDLAGRIVWSPDARRLLFLNLVSDTGADNTYLLDLSSGQKKLFLEKTTLQIVGWR